MNSMVMNNGSDTSISDHKVGSALNKKRIVQHLFSKNGFSWLLYYFFIATHTDALLSDSFFLKLQFRCIFGRRPNMANPQTFNEKLLWMKLYDHRPEYITMVDKYAVKKYVADIIGEQYIIPTIGVWDKPEDIDWDSLPDQFVLKCTHDSGGLVICKDKPKLDKNAAIEKLNASLQRDYYKVVREWQYEKVPKRIIAEKYMEDKTFGELPDYKFFCFDGEVKALFIGTERGSGDVKFDFFDADFNHLDLVQIHPMSGKDLPKPEHFEKMKGLAAKLSKGYPHLRVDLYNVNGDIYFGEITLYHHGGIVPFHPEKWDYTFGSWINLPEKKNNKL